MNEIPVILARNITFNKIQDVVWWRFSLSGCVVVLVFFLSDYLNSVCTVSLYPVPSRITSTPTLCRCCLRWFLKTGKQSNCGGSSAELCAVAPLSVCHPLNVAMVPHGAMVVYVTKVFTGYILQ